MYVDTMLFVVRALCSCFNQTHSVATLCVLDVVSHVLGY